MSFIRFAAFGVQGRLVIAMVVVGLNGFISAKSAPAAQIPALQWDQRSDWLNVKTDIVPPAIGDGKADDTLAIQKALSGVRDGSVLYFPPGTYRITAPLVLKNSTGARWIGGLIVGSGRNTKLVWDGAEGGALFLLNGIAYSRFVGFEMDGQGKASVGFHYQATQGFQTEVTHRHLAFRGFTNAAVLEDHSSRGQALAETTFENCFFEDCGRGVAFLQFNDYDFTFDGCEFQRCGVAIDCAHGNFFEGSGDDPPGHATITGAKVHSFASKDPAKNNLIDIRNYHGEIFIGPYQFYQEPKLMRMKQEGAEPVELFLLACSWYGAKPDPQLSAAAKMWPIGNEFYGTMPDGERVNNSSFFKTVPNPATLAKLSRALDDLRRLGEMDLRLNHP